jgi:hypothetical protein
MKDRRKTSRRRTFRQGTILFNDGRSAIDCTVRNMSDGGGCLEVENPIGPPQRFELTVSGEGPNKKSARSRGAPVSALRFHFMKQQSRRPSPVTSLSRKRLLTPGRRSVHH